jgi:hypothetical protein
MAKDDDIIDDHQGTRVEEERPPRPGPWRELRSRPCDICGKPLGKHRDGFLVTFEGPRPATD